MIAPHGGSPPEEAAGVGDVGNGEASDSEASDGEANDGEGRENVEHADEHDDDRADDVSEPPGERRKDARARSTPKWTCFLPLEMNFAFAQASTSSCSSWLASCSRRPRGPCWHSIPFGLETCSKTSADAQVRSDEPGRCETVGIRNWLNQEG